MDGSSSSPSYPTYPSSGGESSEGPGAYAPPQAGSSHGQGPQAPPYAPPAQPYGALAFYPKNDLGVWALVLGIASIVLSCGIFTGIPAIILGGKAKEAAAAGQANNASFGTAGVVLGWISVGLSVVAVVLFVLLFVGVIAIGGLSTYQS
ncbi:hypothetical protein GCM10025865_28310 [Paraoerskovia sediminicola]|uniref:DUF4190 domain-containing protein n=1 Tax=Paraoerskovia sediminicola TaxID=1138587 RepID=A0ABM8G5X8_9CELL|nr:DUF4190 domain-containing protein [Paraoerskovia sediminicola]BDZ43532.1 hypothetical protein GCM10025865_28310 [Paraoerskovia sediminicola]